MSSNATSFSNLRRLGIKHGTTSHKAQTGGLNRYKSNSQDLLNENNIKSRLGEELNWLEGSHPNSWSIENLLSNKLTIGRHVSTFHQRYSCQRNFLGLYVQFEWGQFVPRNGMIVSQDTSVGYHI